MKKLFLRTLFFLIPFLYSIYVCSQPQTKGRDCSTTCFSTEVVSVQKISATCSYYELEVSYSGKCAHALSHFTVAVPCGQVQKIWNSEGWPQIVGKDPTTGLTGFKIDDIRNFGEGSLKQFRVKFKICSSDENCANQLSCWQPQVAYKASTCVNYETLTISCNTLKASLSTTDASCYGASDGSLTPSIEAGEEPFTFLWSDNSTGDSLAGVPAGTYSVVIKDASGEELTLEGTIGQPEQILISGAITPASCNGSANGTIDLAVSGGAGDYTFKWDNGLETEDLQALAAGQYTVTVTDTKNCSATKKFTVGNTSQITITSTHVKPDCNASNGSIDISFTGGAEPYSFVWSNGATSEDLENIAPGLYTVTVSDNSGCSEKASFFIRDNNTLVLNGTPTPSSCADEASGAINITVTGGTAPYSYSWSNGQTTEDLSALASGNYTVVVKDAKGCTVNAAFNVPKTTFQVSRTVVQPTCHDDHNASITLQEPIGGTGPFSYLWSNGQTGSSLTDLGPGTYSVTITDATGCSRTITSVISNPPAIVATASASNGGCNEEGSFSVDLTVTGGTAPYTFEWSNGDTTEHLVGVQSGTYTVLITDAHGCSISKEVVIEGQVPSWSCLIGELETMPVCGSENNSLSTSVNGADSYSWSIESTDDQWSISGGNSPSILFTAGGEESSATFTLTIVKDGCTKTCTYILSSCTPDDDGGEDPGEEPGDGDGGNQTCEECFDTEAKLIDVSGTCRTYEMKVTTNGLCRHDLSHWTLAIPCGSISNYSNSEGWKMEFGKDPTTGLYGLKVDDISNFGKDVDSFTVRFTLCESSKCDLSSWNPKVAYKAGQCVGLDRVEIDHHGSVSVYPNPCFESINFRWHAVHEDVKLQIIDQCGNTVSTVTKPTSIGDAYYITLESSGLPKGMYYYRMTVDGKTFNGKISKR